MLGRLSARNRIGRLYLGVGVTDTGRRNPAVTAQAAATLHLLTRGRAILGIGPGEREGNEPYGVDWTKPVARFEEALATIRILWNSGGELVNRDSPYFPLRNAIFDLPRIEGRGPRSGLVRTDPACCAWWAATQMAIPWVPPPPTRLRTSSGDRPRGSLRRRAGPNVAGAGSDAAVTTGRNRVDVDEALESEVIKASALQASDEVFSRHGAQHPLGLGFSGAQDLSRHINSSTAATRPSRRSSTTRRRRSRLLRHRAG